MCQPTQHPALPRAWLTSALQQTVLQCTPSPGEKKKLTKQRLLVIFIGLLVISIVIFYWEHFHKFWDKEINPLMHHKFQNVFFSVPICKIPALGGSRQFSPTTNILILGQFSPPKAALFLINNISVSSLLVVVLHNIIKSYLFSTRKWCHWHEYKYFKVKFLFPFVLLMWRCGP